MMKFFINPKALAVLVLLAGFSFRPAHAFDSTAEANSADYQNAVTDADLNAEAQTENLDINESADSEVAIEINHQRALRLTRLLYRGILFREPDAGGLAFYAARIEANGLQGLRSAAFEIGSSAEFRNSIMSQYSARQIVRNAFRVFFYRQPTFNELRYWAPYIRQGQAGYVFRALVSTREFRRLHLRGDNF